MSLWLAIQGHAVWLPGVALLGLGVGFVAGMFGIGGGIALLPIMIYGYGFPFKQAAGTGIMVLLLTAVAGTVEHARQGHVHLGLAVTLMIGSAVSAQLGASATRRASPALLRRVLAGLLLATVAALCWSLAS